MKRHPQFNEPQACHSSVFFDIGQCYGKQNNFFSCTPQTGGGKPNYIRKRTCIFQFMTNVKLDFSNALRSFSNALIYILLYHTFKITENATGKEI